MKPQKIHMTGVGGSGMSALAGYYLALGYSVSGSDLASDPCLPDLTFFSDHSADHLPDDADFLVYSLSIPLDNPERQKALTQNIPQYSYAEALARVVNPLDLLAVAGTHGKTTTTALATWVGDLLGVDPTAFFGSSIVGDASRRHFRLGHFRLAIVEACEYRRSFLHFTPQSVIVPSLDYDHPDDYPTLAEYRQTFAQFFAKLPQNGKLYLPAELEAKDLLTDCSAEVRRFSPADLPSDFSPLLRGQHNLSNLSAVYAFYLDLGFSSAKILEALETFPGTLRRLEFLGQKLNKNFYSDYAHHPTELKALFQNAREQFGDDVLFIFQPHQYSRTLSFRDDFVAVLKNQNVWLTDIFASRDSAEDIAKISAETLAREAGVFFAGSLQSTSQKISEAQAQTIILVGAGDIHSLFSLL